MASAAWLDLGDKSLSRTAAPLVSVIIPCRNEGPSIARCLDSVLASEYPRDRLEVIVADGMSEDNTREHVDRYAARDPRVRRIDNPARTTPQALNGAIAVAQGELILRLDAHSAITPDYIARAAQALERSGADCVGGAMRTVTSGSGAFAASIRIALSHPFGVGNARFRNILQAARTCPGGWIPCSERAGNEKFLSGSGASTSAWNGARTSNSAAACGAPAEKS